MTTETTGPLPSNAYEVTGLGTPRSRRRRWGFVALATAVALFGVAAGAFAGLPGMVERAGLRALGRLEQRFGVRVEADEVEWGYDGHVEARRVVVRPLTGDHDAVIATIEALTIDGDIEAWDRQVRVERVAVTRPVMKLTRDREGRTNVDSVIAAFESMSSGVGGSSRVGGVTLVPALPIITVDDATLAVDAVLPKLPLGLTLPRQATFEGGHITVRPTDVSPTGRLSATPVRIEANFASTSLDPGQGLGFSAEGPLGGAPTRLELRPTRPVRFWLGDRVAGVGGIALTSSGVELGPLQLSVPIRREGGASKVAAAATCERVVVDVPARDLLGRAAAALTTAGDDPRNKLRALMGGLDRIELVHPVISLAIDERGHHDLEDLLPDLPALLEAVTAPRVRTEPGLVRAVADAHHRATDRLIAGKEPDSGHEPARRTLSERVAAPLSKLDRLSRTRLKELSRMIAPLPIAALSVLDGELLLSLPDRQLTLTGVGVDLGQSPTRRHLQVSVAAFDDGRGRRADGDPGFDVQVALDADTGRLQAKLDLRQLPLELLDGVGPVGGRVGAKPTAETPLVAPTGVLTELSLVFDGDERGRSWALSVRASVSGAELKHPSVAADPLRDLSFELAGELRWNGPEGRFTIADGVLRTGGVTLKTSLDVAGALRRPKLHLELELPEIAVQRVVEAIPQGFAPLLRGLRMDGTLAWPVTIELDTAQPRDITIDSRPRSRGLRVLSMGDFIDLSRLRVSHSYGILLGDGSPGHRVMGPMTASWVPLSQITPYLPLALTTTEDGTFYSNEGISTNAMRESIATNLERGSFVRGASTLTQQLVKNLYLDGDKTISRKLQEIFIAWQMALQLGKDEVMALYLNTIEFGPGIYGIKDAAWHWFGKRPIELNLTESIFLASIIPGPRRYYSFFQQGVVTERWRGYLERLLKIMVERGKITEQELEAAAPYEPRFRGAGGSAFDTPPEDFDLVPEEDPFGQP